jgi:hypothetical protein
MAVWYCEDDGASHAFGWSALTARANSTVYVVGDIRKQDGSVTVGNERAYMCVVAGTSGASSPAWTYTKGAQIADGGVTWREVSGQPAVNGDAANTVAWAASTAYALTASVIKNTAGAYYFICITAGTTGSGEPAWNTSTGATTADNTTAWTCIGAVGAFANYAAPHARAQTPMGAGFMAAGDALYVSDRHNQTQTTGVNLVSSNGTADFPLSVICVDHTNVPPTTLATTGAIVTTGAGAYIRFCIHAYIYGLVFTCGNQSNISGLASTSSVGNVTVEHCTVNLGSSFIIGYMDTGTYSSKIRVNDCIFNYGSVGHSMALYGPNIEMNRIVLTGSVPTVAFYTNAHADVAVNDSDLSLITSTLINSNAAANYKIIVSNCKLGAGVTLLSGTLQPSFKDVSFYNCSSGNTNYENHALRYEGAVDHETTTVRTGGASDGTTAVSAKAAANATASVVNPLALAPIAQWNETTGLSLTATVEIAGAASLTNGDIWLDVEYPGDAASSKGAGVSSRKGLLAAASAVTSSSASWGGSPVYRQKLQCTFTPQKKGPVVARVYVAKPNATVYVDPMITIA